MQLELLFDDLGEEVLDAVVDVRLADLAVADALSDGPSAMSGDLTVTPARPTARVSVDLPVAPGTYEPGLLVRVRGRTVHGGPIEFFNTGSTPVTDQSRGPVRVLLSRIA
jgi:hypothetical protein